VVHKVLNSRNLACELDSHHDATGKVFTNIMPETHCTMFEFSAGFGDNGAHFLSVLFLLDVENLRYDCSVYEHPTGSLSLLFLNRRSWLTV